MRRRLSYANITATLALVFAMSGGALAANHYLINSTKQINPKVLKKLVGKAGATGPQGPTGKEGAAGKEGSLGKEGQPGKAATIPALTWQNLTLENGWKAYGGYGATPAFTKDVEGFVHLTGSLSGSAKTSEVIAVLPPGFRPPEGAWVPVGSSNGSYNPFPVNIYISSSGTMEVANGTGANDSFVSLEGVTFYAGG